MVNLQKRLVGHWTLDSSDTSNGTAYDSNPYNNHGNIFNPTDNYFGPSSSGYWQSDIEQLGSVDGFNDVGKADATANTSFEYIFLPVNLLVQILNIQAMDTMFIWYLLPALKDNQNF